jgi:hypothetical protein
MRIYSSILLSSILIAGGTTYISRSLSLDAQIQIFAEGNNNGNKPCVRGGDRRECYSRLNLSAQLDQSIDPQTSEDGPRGSGRVMG